MPWKLAIKRSAPETRKRMANSCGCVQHTTILIVYFLLRRLMVVLRLMVGNHWTDSSLPARVTKYPGPAFEAQWPFQISLRFLYLKKALTLPFTSKTTSYRLTMYLAILHIIDFKPNLPTFNNFHPYLISSNYPWYWYSLLWRPLTIHSVHCVLICKL